MAVSWSMTRTSTIFLVAVAAMVMLLAVPVTSAEAQTTNIVRTTIKATDQTGKVLHMYVSIYFPTTGGRISGFTPYVLATDAGLPAYVTVHDYQTLQFDRWADGKPSRTYFVQNWSGDDTITAQYINTAISSTNSIVTVKAKLTSGAALNGMYTTVYNVFTGAKVNGFTPLTYNNVPPGTYQVWHYNYGRYVFDHWEGYDGGLFNVDANTNAKTVTAVYRIQ